MTSGFAIEPIGHGPVTHNSRRNRIIGGIAVGASASALFGGLFLGSPSGASEPLYHFAKPEMLDNVPAATLVEGEQQLVGAAGAGSYVIQRTGDHLTIVAASPAAGWKVDVLHNDGRYVKAVFTSPTTMVFAAARLDDAGMVAVEAFEKAVPVKVLPAVAKAEVRGDDVGRDGDHDGWCDGDKDGRSFDGDRDGDRDGKHRGGWDGDRDGR